MNAYKHSLIRNFGFGFLAIIAVAATSLAGQLATYPNLAPWYAGLAKPSFNPPNWVFGPVWTTLYLLMAFSAWRILRLPGTPERRWALGLFFVQLAMNAAWSWMFFAANNPLLGLTNIIPQLDYYRNCRGFLPTRQDRGLESHPAGGMGCLCYPLEFCDLEAESLAHQRGIVVLV
jgi:tryptophan-rich sensory protein